MEDQLDQPTYTDNFGKALIQCIITKSGLGRIPLELAATEIYEMDWLRLWEFCAANAD